MNVAALPVNIPIIHLLVGSEVVGFTRGCQTFLADSTNHNNLPFVDNGAKHGSGRLHRRHLLPFRPLVVVCEHLVDGLTLPII